MSESRSCPTDAELVAILEGESSFEDLSVHVDGCLACQGVLAELAITFPASEESAATRSGGVLDHVGRYEIHEELGSGGMGVVYRATDPILQRTVAIKLLQPAIVEGRSATAARQRLLREGRALAALSHPHVLPVYEIGEWQDQIYIAMEYVNGTTIDVWAGKQGRTQADITAALVQAAKGLLAAHREGIIHRDVKPSNILIGADDRVRVTDFGLAKAEQEPTSIDTPLTATGVWVGTPGYIAPEVLSGRQADARADQFSFCLTLAECLTRVRPLAGASMEELKKVDPRVANVVVKGLAIDPAARFASMSEVVESLTLRPELSTRKRSGSWVWIAAALAVVVAGAVALRWWPRNGRSTANEREVAAITADNEAFMKLYFDAVRSRIAGDGKQCLSLLDRAAHVNASRNNDAILFPERATCSMLVGDCSHGEQLLRTSYKNSLYMTEELVKLSVNTALEKYCPIDNLNTHDEKLRAVLSRVRYAHNPKDCRDLLGHLERLEPQAALIAESDTLRNIGIGYRNLATCLADASDCETARQLEEKGLSLVASDLSPQSRAESAAGTIALNPTCAPNPVR